MLVSYIKYRELASGSELARKCVDAALGRLELTTEQKRELLQLVARELFPEQENAWVVSSTPQGGGRPAGRTPGSRGLGGISLRGQRTPPTEREADQILFDAETFLEGMGVPTDYANLTSWRHEVLVPLVELLSGKMQSEAARPVAALEKTLVGGKHPKFELLPLTPAVARALLRRLPPAFRYRFLMNCDRTRNVFVNALTSEERLKLLRGLSGSELGALLLRIDPRLLLLGYLMEG